VTGVRSIKAFEIDLAERTAAKARAAVEEMCRKLLANPVIHDYDIKVDRGRIRPSRR
jgi:phosphoribosylformylglycinamidine synthase